MRCSPALYLLVLATVNFSEGAVKKKKLLDAITVCKRNDPELSKCLWTNANIVIPRLKEGVPEMNIIPIEPAVVKDIEIEFTQARSVRLRVHLQNVTVYGLSEVRIQKCDVFHTLDGIQAYLELRFQRSVLKSLYKAVGNFMLVGINATGDLCAELTEVKSQSVWNSTRYVKNNKEYLNYTAEITNLTIGNMTFHFDKLFGNNTDLTEGINHIINENINLLYEDVKSVIWDTILRVVGKVANDFHGTFPYDVLYPNA